DAVEGDATAAAAAAEEHPPLTPPDDAERADSGLAWVVLTPGNETEAPTGEKDAAVVVLRAWQADGARLTDAEPTPTRVAVDAASPGVREALTMMRPGEARRVWLPASLAPSFGRPEAELLTLELELLTLERAAPEPVVAVAAEETAVAKAPVKKADVPAKKPDTTAKKPDTAATTKTPTPVAKEKTGKELYDEAWELHKRGDLDGALPVYYDAAQHGYPRAYKQLGVLLERRGRPDAALEAYRRYLTALPSAPDADWVRGDIARLSGTAP
ncbi:MAG: tetratricopeptide repeat protein, partial [Myxococcales bacterium]|nr:tetratricopeptide repeat protein [Myxococcales bacterium]